MTFNLSNYPMPNIKIIFQEKLIPQSKWLAYSSYIQ